MLGSRSEPMQSSITACYTSQSANLLHHRGDEVKCLCGAHIVSHNLSNVFPTFNEHTMYVSNHFWGEIYKTAGAYSLQIYDYLSQIQVKTNAFRLIVRHNTEGPPIPDWQ